MEQAMAQTTHGLVRGEIYGGAFLFRGIPYGGDCEGARRFLPPSPAQDWAGVRDCTQNGPIACQYGGSINGQAGFGKFFSGNSPERFRCEQEEQRENCLVLNVVTPGLDAQKRPVVVYIHGGGFASGSGSLVLGADTWAKEEDIVVVGVNHRLNAFGYLYLGWYAEEYASSGMAGILDLVLALQWVRDNIAFFGGDPEKVTIMGESGGGCKINHLLAMPCAKGLFRAAIVESGSGLSGTVSKAQATETAQTLLRRLSIPENDARALLALPAASILAASRGLDFSPCADGIFLPFNGEQAFWEADSSLPLLVGASEEELAAFAPPGREMSWAQLQEALCAPEDARRGMDIAPMSPEQAERVIGVFRARDAQADALHVFYRICSLANMLGGGAYRQALQKAQSRQGAVYNYWVTFASPSPFEPEKRYSWHTADLPLQMRLVAYPQCETISRIMGCAWGAFIRTGSPDTDGLPWPAFTVERQNVMVLGDTCRVEIDPTQPCRAALGLL